MKPTRKNKLAGLGLAAGLLAGAGAGFVLEMSGSAGAAGSTAAAVVAPAATEDTDTTDTDTRPDRAAHIQEALQPLIDDGTVTQVQADAVIAALEAARPEGGRGGMRGGPHLETAATALGLTEDEVRTALQDGQTLAELATANGTTAQAVIDALVADVTTHLDEKVAAGTLTQEEADARLAEATTRITERVNNGGPAGGPEGRGPEGRGSEGRGPGGRGMHGPRGDMPADDTGS